MVVPNPVNLPSGVRLIRLADDARARIIEIR
jgi:hypothetical protein